ncbi:MAG: hypothetical protein OCD03_00375 [Hyphomicrobiales bacterium]
MLKLLKILVVSTFITSPFAALANTGNHATYFIVKEDPADMMVKGGASGTPEKKKMVYADIKAMAESLVNLTGK